MNIINEKSNKIAHQLVSYGSPQNVAFDPITTLTIISIIISIIQVLQKCMVKPQNAASKITSGPLVKWTIRNAIKKQINKVDASRQDIRSLVFDIEKAIQAEALKTTTEEFTTMYREADAA